MVLRVIKFYKKTWLNSYTDMDTDLGKASNMILKKTFSTQWMIQFKGQRGKMFEETETWNSLQQRKKILFGARAKL